MRFDARIAMRKRNADRDTEAAAMNTPWTFVCLAAAAAVAAVAISAGGRAAGPAIKLDRLAFALDACPFAATADGGGLLLRAALMTPLRPDSGFDCPINRVPASRLPAPSFA